MAKRLSRALYPPRYEAEPPRRRLERELDKARHTGNAYEAKIAAERRGERTGKFRQPIEPAYNECNPPEGYDDGIPEFLDRR
jgi:hypothetical protein